MKEINIKEFKALSFDKKLSVYEKMKGLFMKDSNPSHNSLKQERLKGLSDIIIANYQPELPLNHRIMDVLFADLKSASVDIQSLLIFYGFAILKPFIKHSTENVLIAVRYFDEQDDKFNVFTEEMIVKTLKNMNVQNFNEAFIEELKSIINSNRHRSKAENNQLFHTVIGLLMRASRYRHAYMTKEGVSAETGLFNSPTEFAVKYFLDIISTGKNVQLLNNLIKMAYPNNEDYNKVFRHIENEFIMGQEMLYKASLFDAVFKEDAYYHKHSRKDLNELLAILDTLLNDTQDLYVNFARRKALISFMQHYNIDCWKWLKTDETFKERLEKEVAQLSHEIEALMQPASKEASEILTQKYTILYCIKIGSLLLKVIKDYGYHIDVPEALKASLGECRKIIHDLEVNHEVQTPLDDLYIQEINEFIHEVRG